MATAIAKGQSMGDLLEKLGGISPRRVCLKPAPGTATMRDLIWFNDHTNRIYELVEGTLVEKAMGWAESSLTMSLGRYVGNFLDEHDFGVLSGESGGTRLMLGLVRMPDLSFISWDRLPIRGQIPTDPVLKVIPNLAVEVLSKGNTRGEMLRKLKEYFLAGVVLVWYIDPKRRTVKVYTAPDKYALLTEDQTLDGGEVLPGFTLPLRKLFAQLPPVMTEASGKRRAANGKRKSDRE